MTATLEVNGLSVQFGGVAALSSVTFAVASGTVTSLIGPNGAGKTTAFNVITGFQRPASGRVSHEGVGITGWRPHRIAARGLVRTFQKTSVFPGLTVVDNVLTGLHLRGRVGVGSALFRRGRVSDEEWTSSGWAAGAASGRAACRTGSSASWSWGWRWPRAPGSCSWTSRPRG